MLDPRALRRGALAVVALASLLGLAAEIAFAKTADAPIALVDTLAPMLSLSGEANLPTWVSSMLLFACALVAGAIAMARTDALRRGFWGTCAVFVYASIDESVQLHEHLGGHYEFGGILYFDWVIWAAVLVVALAIAFWPFVRALPAITRTRLVVAGAIYLGGAIAMELPLGWWTDRHGVDGLGYALIDWVEETMEMIGAALALFALAAERDIASAR